MGNTVHDKVYSQNHINKIMNVVVEHICLHLHTKKISLKVLSHLFYPVIRVALHLTMNPDCTSGYGGFSFEF